MKKITLFLLSLVLIFSLVACSSSQKPSNNSSLPTSEPNVEITQMPTVQKDSNDELPSEAPSSVQKEENKTLVVYFSVPETTDPNNMTKEEDNSVVVIDGEVLGNTQYVANVIQENTDADIFRIEPQIPYTTDHDDLVDLAKEEQNENARPELKANVENIDQYDTIFIGYPNWWGDMPMILYTFFDNNDFSGKTIIPFNTHGGSGFSGTISTIAELEPNAVVNKDGYTVSRNNVQEAESDVLRWLQELGYTK